MKNTTIIALKLAEALLLYKGEISIEDIKVLPFLDDPRNADLIAKYLRSKFKTKSSVVKISQGNMNTWEEVIELIS